MLWTCFNLFDRHLFLIGNKKNKVIKTIVAMNSMYFTAMHRKMMFSRVFQEFFGSDIEASGEHEPKGADV